VYTAEHHLRNKKARHADQPSDMEQPAVLVSQYSVAVSAVEQQDCRTDPAAVSDEPSSKHKSTTRQGRTAEVLLPKAQHDRMKSMKGSIAAAGW
jgi:hypothetical protein